MGIPCSGTSNYLQFINYAKPFLERITRGIRERYAEVFND